MKLTSHVIEANQLTHYFGKRQVLSSLNLAIPSGVVFGLLGRNGSGKSTFIHIVLGLLRPTRGTTSIFGCDSQALPPELLYRVGYLAEGHHVQNWMTVRDQAHFRASFYPNWNWDIYHSIIKFFQLDDHRYGGSLSLGERAGLCLALTVAPEPDVLIFDDPTLGLDPIARRNLLEAMLYITRREHRTILFASHMLSDVERLADQIAVIDKGVLRALCTVDEFMGRIRKIILRFKTTPPPLPPIPGLLHAVRTDREICVVVANYTVEAADILERLCSDTMETVALDLEDAFISYCGDKKEKSFLVER